MAGFTGPQSTGPVPSAASLANASRSGIGGGIRQAGAAIAGKLKEYNEQQKEYKQALPRAKNIVNMAKDAGLIPAPKADEINARLDDEDTPLSKRGSYAEGIEKDMLQTIQLGQQAKRNQADIERKKAITQREQSEAERIEKQRQAQREAIVDQNAMLIESLDELNPDVAKRYKERAEAEGATPEFLDRMNQEVSRRIEFEQEKKKYPKPYEFTDENGITWVVHGSYIQQSKKPESKDSGDKDMKLPAFAKLQEYRDAKHQELRRAEILGDDERATRIRKVIEEIDQQIQKQNYIRGKEEGTGFDLNRPANAKAASEKLETHFR